MKIIMDSDVLIKLTKASLKDLVSSHFELYVSSEVKKETVDEGRQRGYADASVIDENIGKGRLKVVETRRTEKAEKLVKSLNLQGGEADSVRLFKQGTYETIASDDSRFIDLLEGLAIPYVTPSALLIYLWKTKVLSKHDARQSLDKIKEFVSSDEYLTSIEELARE